MKKIFSNTKLIIKCAFCYEILRKLTEIITHLNRICSGWKYLKKRKFPIEYLWISKLPIDGVKFMAHIFEVKNDSTKYLKKQFK